MGEKKTYPLMEILRTTGAPVFGVAGTHIMGLLREMSRTNLASQYIPARTELCAGFMATGHSRFTSKVSFCLVTPGPGFLIGAAAMLEAKMKGTPVIFISGQIHRDVRGIGAKALHEFEAQSDTAAKIIESSFFPLTPGEVNKATAEAIKSALSRPHKPSYVELPVEILRDYHGDAGQLDLSPVKPLPPENHIMRKMAALINMAKFPIIFAGFGSIFTGCEKKLTALAEKIQAPLFTTITGKGAIPETHTLSAGVYRPSTGRETMEKADLLIALGMSFSSLSTGNRKGPFPKKILNVNIDGTSPAIPGAEVIPLQCSVEDFLDSANLDEKGRGNELIDMLAGVQRTITASGRENYPLEMAYVEILEKHVPEDALIFTDPTILSYWMRYFFKARGAGLYHYPSGSNSLGFAFPAAIGRLVGKRNQRAFVITGDGNFPYFAGEISTATDKDLDITIILFNDSGYGVLREWNRWENLERIGVNLKNPSFRKICEAFGIEYNIANSPKDLGIILKRGKNRRGTRLIEVEEILLPPWKLL